MAQDDGGRAQSYYDSNDGGSVGGSRMAKATEPSEQEKDLKTASYASQYESDLVAAITNESDKWPTLVDIRDKPTEMSTSGDVRRRWESRSRTPPHEAHGQASSSSQPMFEIAKPVELSYFPEADTASMQGVEHAHARDAWLTKLAAARDGNAPDKLALIDGDELLSRLAADQKDNEARLSVMDFITKLVNVGNSPAFDKKNIPPQVYDAINAWSHVEYTASAGNLEFNHTDQTKYSSKLQWKFKTSSVQSFQMKGSASRLL